MGKTVLLARLAEVAQEAGWEPCSLEFGPGHNHDEGMARAVIALVQEAQRRISTMERIKHSLGTVTRGALASVGVTYNDITITLGAGSIGGSVDLARCLLDGVRTAAEHGREGLVLLLDEAQVIRDERDRRGEHPLSLLITAISALQRLELPVGLVLCGLPTLTGNLLRARSYTERMFRGEELGRLPPVEAAAALSRPLESRSMQIDDEVVRRVVEEVEGYPYFIQLWGAELWDAARYVGRTTFDPPLLDATTPEIYRRLDIDFYEPRVSTLTPAEQDVLLATARCPYPPVRTANLNTHVDKTPGNVNVLLGRLVEAGVLYRIRKGEYEYTAPKFRQYLGRRTSIDPLGG
ncbi:hypothetical protein L6R50_03185 [Myxococcota bacterium]|nr:hypothetical protein [Myxococcota bacterium]